MHKSNLTDLSDIHNLAGIALQNGADRPAFNAVEWNIGGQCLAPVRIEKYGRPPAGQDGMTTIIPGQTKIPFGITLHAPCRNCEICLRSRRWEWHHRAMFELIASPRTWFATLTLRPAARMNFLSRARKEAAKQGEDLETYSEIHQFRMVARQVNAEINLYLARLRKQGPFRYLLVFERHKDGQPHMHALIHEREEGTLPERFLRHSWRCGHSMFKVTAPEPSTAGYVAKYLSKSNLARVRASLHYGKLRPHAIVGVRSHTQNVSP